MPLPPGTFTYPIYCGSTIPTRQLEKIVGEETVAVDTETTGLTPEMGAVPFGVSYASLSGAVFLRNTDPPIEFSKHCTVWHNAKFDWRMLGIRDLSNFDDTLLLARCVMTRPGKMHLKQLGKELLGIEADEEAKVHGWLKQEARRRKVKWRQVSWADVPPAIMERYAAVDAAETLLLLPLLKGMQDPETQRAYEIDLGCVAPCAAMEREGIPVSMPMVQRLRAQAARTVAALGAEIRARWGIANPGSQPQVLDALRTFFPRSDIQNTTKDTLLTTYARSGELVVDQLLRWRQATKMVGFFDGFDKHLCPDGRIHCSLNLGRTITTRFSASEPNLQQIPKRDPWGVRRCLRVPRGQAAIFWDYSQIENITGAVIMGAPPDFIEKLNLGQKFYIVVSEYIYGQPYESGEEYELAKKATLSKQYGAGIDKLTDSINIEQLKKGKPIMTRAEVATIVGKMNEGMPFIPRFFRQVERELNERGYVETPFGRRFYANLSIPAYKYVNFIIQSTAADIMKLGLRRVWEKYSGDVRLCMTIHDELVAHVERKGPWEKIIGEVKKDLTTLELPPPLNHLSIRCGPAISLTHWKNKRRV